jgi:hypothetical protein
MVDPRSLVASGLDEADAAAADAAADARGDAAIVTQPPRRKKRPREVIEAEKAAKAARKAARVAKAAGAAGAEKAARASAAGAGPGDKHWSQEETEALIESYAEVTKSGKTPKGKEFFERLKNALRAREFLREEGACAQAVVAAVCCA